jgi:hypothetical protein
MSADDLATPMMRRRARAIAQISITPSAEFSPR